MNYESQKYHIQQHNLIASEMAGAVEGWKARAEAAEARISWFENQISHYKEDLRVQKASHEMRVKELEARRRSLTEEMVERAAKIYAKRVLGSDEGWRRAKVDVRRAYTALARAALTAALEKQELKPINPARFRRAPCYRCGYNGPGYFQAETHPCAEEYHRVEGLAALEARHD